MCLKLFLNFRFLLFPFILKPVLHCIKILSSCFGRRESLYEDEEFDQRQLAALLVSKVKVLVLVFLDFFWCSSV